MKILAISTTHDASAAIIEDGKLIYYRMAERLSRVKHDESVKTIAHDLLQFKKTYFDKIIISNCNPVRDFVIGEHKSIIEFFKNFMYGDIIITYINHHLFHAYCAFYNSNFNSAICIIVDGQGSVYDENIVKFKFNKFHPEKESIFYFENDDNKIILKNYHDVYYWDYNKKDFDSFLSKYNPLNYNIEENCKSFDDLYFYYSNSLGIGDFYELASYVLKFKDKLYSIDGSGKVMGLAQYKNYENQLQSPYDTIVWQKNVDFAYNTQKIFEERMINLIKYAIEKTKNNNVILSGGCALNCVANYLYLKEIPNINLYIDPICFDAGQSIGAAYYYHKLFSKDIDTGKHSI